MRRPIRVLPETLVGRIAAGEVVERPASVVKELVENALDAGSARIAVEIEGGLTGLLRVADDGAGIPAEELPLAVERHATSKIGDGVDLDRIDTLGFRGEGLAAIGAVSRLSLISRAAGASEAAILVVDGGKIGTPRPAGRSAGTTVEVADLFFNTPARRKYMKSGSAELRQIVQILQAYALAYPAVHVSLSVEGKSVFDFPPAPDLHARAGQIVGRERLAEMIPVVAETPGFALEGFLGAPENSRIRVGHQIFLLNSRFIASPLLRTAVRQAYGDLIPPARHPEAILHLRLPPDEVDVNVHPTKREVRLLKERDLYPRLIHLLREPVESRFPVLRMRGAIPAPFEAESGTRQIRLGLDPPRPDGAGWVADAERKGPEILPFPGIPQGERDDEEDDGTPAMASMWQVHSMYILASIAGGLLIIDQHAAHERVLYEEALQRLRGDGATSQELLFPQVVELTPDEVSLLLEVTPILEKLGFHLELFGGTTVLVHAIPIGLREWRHGALLRDVLDDYTEHAAGLDIQERVARSVACQGAVKAGTKLSLEEMNALVDQLFATQKPQGDPHGRPVFLRIPLEELHRRFGRSG